MDTLVPSDAVRAIQESVKTETMTVPDGDYATRPVFLPPAEPRAAILEINTLTGIVDFLKSDIDRLVDDGAQVHVVSATQVDVIGKLEGRHRQRNVFLRAESDDILEKVFEFGRWYDAETFNISLQSLFADDEDRADVLKLVGNIKDETVMQAKDDGVTQGVTVKSGITLVERAEVPNPVTLIPFRTFPEIEQPPSDFILRLRPREGKLPECALFEADGGKWQLEAITRIRAFLQTKLEGVPIIA